MMTIYDLLKKENCRISYNSRWLVLDEYGWTVYENKPYAKRTKIIVQTKDENKAIGYLLGKDKHDDKK